MPRETPIGLSRPSPEASVSPQQRDRNALLDEMVASDAWKVARTGLRQEQARIGQRLMGHGYASLDEQRADQRYWQLLERLIHRPLDVLTPKEE